MKSLGIDIGSYSIKIVEVQPSSKGAAVTQFVEHVLNTNPGQDVEIQTIEFLRSFLATYDPANTEFSFAIRQDRVAIRNKFFPFAERMKILKSLPFELEEDLPFSTDNAIYDAKILKYSGVGAEVLACATPKIHVKTLLDTVEGCGVDPSLFSAEAFALSNLMEDWNAAPPKELSAADPNGSDSYSKQLQLLLYIGHSRTVVLAMERGRLIAVRTILWGGNNVIQAIAKRYGLAPLDALKEFQTKSFILTQKQGRSNDQLIFSDTISNSVKELVKDLSLINLEMKTELNATISQVLVTGGASQIQNLCPFLTQSLDLPASIFSPLDRFPMVSFERNPATLSKMGVALGLAVEGLKKPRNPAINFLKGEFANQGNPVEAFTNKWGYTIGLATAAFILLFIFGQAREIIAGNLVTKIEEDLSQQAISVANLPVKKNASAETTLKSVKKFISQSNKRIAEASTIANLTKINSPLEMLKKFSESIPSRDQFPIEISVFEINDTKASITGTLANDTQVATLKQIISSFAVNSQVTVNPSQKVGTRQGFSFSWDVDRGIKAVKK